MAKEMKAKHDKRALSPRAQEIGKFAHESSVAAAVEHFGVSKSYVQRSRRFYREVERGGQGADFGLNTFDDTLLREITERYSKQELRMLAKGINMQASAHDDCIHDFGGEELCIGAMSDLHLGSVYTDSRFIDEAFSVFEDEGVDFVTVGGDITEGVSHRQGHCYECSYIGVDAQIEHSVEVLGQWQSAPVYAISGNHDAWSFKAVGVDPAKYICEKLDWNYLGYDEGDIEVNGCKIRLWHGQDASSYAHSYRIQKVVESFTGGDKPNVLLAGHVHKMGYWMDRHVHCVSTGCIQKQSKWMRGKRLPAHTGFWVIRMTINEKGIGTFNPKWFPFYQ